MKTRGICLDGEKKEMSEEVKGLLHRLLWSISENGEAGVTDGIGEMMLDTAEYEFNYLMLALREMEHINKGEEVDFDNVREALDRCISRNMSIKDKAKAILDYGHCRALSDFFGDANYREKKKELDSMYHPSDELLDELIELI